MYRTLQDLSSAQVFMIGRICACHSGDFFSFPRAMQLLMASIRTESCSSLDNFSKTWMSSFSMESCVITSATLPKTFAA